MVTGIYMMFLHLVEDAPVVPSYYSLFQARGMCAMVYITDTAAARLKSSNANLYVNHQ